MRPRGLALLATATPAIAASNGGLRDTSWIAVAYLLASATVVPAYGRIGDRRGRREMLLAAFAIFTVGPLGCGLAQTFPQLIVARVVQGLGGGGCRVIARRFGCRDSQRAGMRFAAEP